MVVETLESNVTYYKNNLNIHKHWIANTNSLEIHIPEPSGQLLTSDTLGRILSRSFSAFLRSISIILACILSISACFARVSASTDHQMDISLSFSTRDHLLQVEIYLMWSVVWHVFLSWFAPFQLFLVRSVHAQLRLLLVHRSHGNCIATFVSKNKRGNSFWRFWRSRAACSRCFRRACSLDLAARFCSSSNHQKYYEQQVVR